MARRPPVADLRAGADFQKLVIENSDRPDAAKTKGKVDTLPVKDLNEKYAGAVKGVKVGSYTDPIEADDTGVSILRVDELTAASNESQFDESAVRLEMMKENIAPEPKKFMATLRGESYIKINDAYRPLVSPILFADERAVKGADTAEDGHQHHLAFRFVRLFAYARRLCGRAGGVRARAVRRRGTHQGARWGERRAGALPLGHSSHRLASRIARRDQAW